MSFASGGAGWNRLRLAVLVCIRASALAVPYDANFSLAFRPYRISSRG